jgi:hydroxymethylpyrimidine/phosphomethylpyrimidine kinase
MSDEEKNDVPVVMCFSGSDPTGGAGIQADIETLASMGCHAVPVITAITVQDTQDVQGFSPCDLTMITEQARAVLEDMPVDAFKIGMLGSTEAVEAVHSILRDYPDVPVVFDPVLASGAGTTLVDEDFIDAIVALLIPEATIFTPNSLEARAIAHEADNPEACAHELLDMGAEYVLITGTHENTEKVRNVLYTNHRQLDAYEFERLPHSYHGSGCTLASAIAALLAQGLDPMAACHEAQQYTWQALQAGRRIGMGQYLPNRFFWAQEDTPENS